MKRPTFPNETDKFVRHLLRNYSEGIHQETEELSPFFMTHLRSRISAQHQVTQFWEFGVISARKWLVALSCIALLFFFGNLIVMGTQSHLLIRVPTESSQYELEDSEDVHSEALNVDLLQKE